MFHDIRHKTGFLSGIKKDTFSVLSLPIKFFAVFLEHCINGLRLSLV
jgi:hypothetical protein